MNSLKSFFFLFTLLFLASCSIANKINNSMEENNGKCKALCVVPKLNKVYYSEEYAIYTGNEDEEDVEISEISVLIRPSSTGWEKRKADRNCHSANPDDCLVWCRVEIPEIREKIKVLMDTTQSKNFEFRPLTYEEVDDSIEEKTEWKDVLCEEDLTPKIILQIKTSLNDQGHFLNLNEPEFNLQTKEALKSFQRNNDLPVGHLDFETLDVLGVSY